MFSRILKLCDLSWKSLTELKAWLKLSASSNSLSPEAFHNPSLRVAQATDASGQTVVYCPIETVWLIRAYAVNPQTTAQDARKAGDAIDSQIECEAQLAGIQKLILVIPKDQPFEPEGDWSEVRVFERKIAQSIAMGAGVSQTPLTTAYVN